MSTEKKKHFNLKDQTGYSFTTNQGYKATVVNYESYYNCDIKFDFGLIIRNVSFGCAKKKSIKNPFHKSVCDWGYIGIGEYETGSKAHIAWQSMINRVQKHNNYFDCSVTEEWSCFQVFAKWFEENYNPETMKGWGLDKDVLVKGNKVYSPETCCFIPSAVNTLFVKCNKSRGDLPIGVSKEGSKYTARINSTTYLGIFDTPEKAFELYKKAKEAYIKEVADKWKGLIAPRVYHAMYNYQVEITD